MSNLNRIVLIGAVKEAPEPKFSQDSNLSRSKFTLSVARPPRQDGQTEYDSIPVIAWGRAADYVAENVQAGALVVVEGKIQTNQLENNGIKQWLTEVNANLVRSLGGASASAAGPARSKDLTAPAAAPQPDTAANPFEVTADDVPF